MVMADQLMVAKARARLAPKYLVARAQGISTMQYETKNKEPMLLNWVPVRPRSASRPMTRALPIRRGWKKKVHHFRKSCSYSWESFGREKGHKVTYV